MGSTFVISNVLNPIVLFACDMLHCIFPCGCEFGMPKFLLLLSLDLLPK